MSDWLRAVLLAVALTAGDVLVAAWPGEPRILERLLGGPAPTTNERLCAGRSCTGRLQDSKPSRKA